MKVLILALSLAAAAHAASDACTTISTSISADANVYRANSTEYTLAIEHWLLSSIEEPQCVVEPSNAADIGVIVSCPSVMNSVQFFNALSAEDRQRDSDTVRSQERRTHFEQRVLLHNGSPYLPRTVQLHEA
jgi:hypothetical protein